jgi:hypothetical protein
LNFERLWRSFGSLGRYVTMSEENKNESRREYFMVMAVAILLPLLYVLSFGPTSVVVEKYPKCVPAFQEFYLPVIWLYEHTALQRPLDFYIRFCGGRTY